jgi:hypothetical protein
MHEQEVPELQVRNGLGGEDPVPREESVPEESVPARSKRVTKWAAFSNPVQVDSDVVREVPQVKILEVLTYDRLAGEETVLGEEPVPE